MRLAPAAVAAVRLFPPNSPSPSAPCIHLSGWHWHLHGERDKPFNLNGINGRHLTRWRTISTLIGFSVDMHPACCSCPGNEVPVFIYLFLCLFIYLATLEMCYFVYDIRRLSSSFSFCVTLSILSLQGPVCNIWLNILPTK